MVAPRWFRMPDLQQDPSELATGQFYVSCSGERAWEHTVRVTGVPWSEVQWAGDALLFFMYELGLLKRNDPRIRVSHRQLLAASAGQPVLGRLAQTGHLCAHALSFCLSSSEHARFVTCHERPDSRTWS